jgi:hypothetical protein
LSKRPDAAARRSGAQHLAPSQSTASAHSDRTESYTLLVTKEIANSGNGQSTGNVVGMLWNKSGETQLSPRDAVRFVPRMRLLGPLVGRLSRALSIISSALPAFFILTQSSKPAFPEPWRRMAATSPNAQSSPVHPASASNAAVRRISRHANCALE